MGSSQSYLRAVPQQPIHSLGYEHLYQQLQQPGLGLPTLGAVAEHSTFGPQIDLTTRLFLLEKDLQIVQAENIKKEAVIQYLLNTKLAKSIPDHHAEELKKIILSLKEKITVYKGYFDKSRNKLRRGRDAILASGTPNVDTDSNGSSSTSGFDCSKASQNLIVKAEDLIDLSELGEDSAAARTSEEDTTLLEDSYDDLSDSENSLGEAAPVSNMVNAFSSGITEDSIHAVRRFVDGVTKPISGNGTASTKKARVVTSAPKITVCLPFQSFGRMPSPESDDSSPHHSSSPSGPVSASTSFNSSSSNEETLAIEGWQIAASNAMAATAALLPQKLSVDQALNAMKALNYPLPMLDMVKRAGTALESSRLCPETPQRSSTATYAPRWSKSKVFNSDRERSTAQAINERSAGFSDLRCPDIFKHGVRYDPDESRRDVYRTVVVSGIPAGVEMDTVLSQVRGGPVIEATLMDTIKMTGKNSALIVFLHEHSAMAYEDYAKKNPIVLGGLQARVDVLSTPTWPIRIHLRKAMYDHQHTRCLEVRNFPRDITPTKLRNDLRVCEELKSHRIVVMKMRKDRILELQFSSIDSAGHVYGMLTSFKAYRECSVCFVADPCAQSVDTLLENGTGAVEEVFAGSSNDSPFQDVIGGVEAISAEPPDNISIQENYCVVKEASHEPHDDSDGSESAALGQSGRLTKVDLEDEAQVCRGRGFEKEN